MVPDNCPAGRLVRLEPEPLNVVAVINPLDGLNCSFVLLTYCVVRLPVVILEKIG